MHEPANHWSYCCKTIITLITSPQDKDIQVQFVYTEATDQKQIFLFFSQFLSSADAYLHTGTETQHK